MSVAPIQDAPQSIRKALAIPPRRCPDSAIMVPLLPAGSEWAERRCRSAVDGYRQEAIRCNFQIYAAATHWR